MSVIETEAQKIYRMFQLTDKEKKDVSIIKAKFTAHFTPHASHAYNRYKFNQIIKKEGESFTYYVTAAQLQVN